MNDLELLQSAFESSFDLSNSLTLLKKSTFVTKHIEHQINNAIIKNRQIVMQDLQVIKDKLIIEMKKQKEQAKCFEGIDLEIKKLQLELSTPERIAKNKRFGYVNGKTF